MSCDARKVPGVQRGFPNSQSEILGWKMFLIWARRSIFIKLKGGEKPEMDFQSKLDLGSTISVLYANWPFIKFAFARQVEDEAKGKLFPVSPN